MATLYAPNEDEPSFFQDLFDHLSDFQCDDLIIGGDFNLILDLDKVKKGGCYKTHTRSITRGGGGGVGGEVLPKKMGRGVRPASQNPYPIYE